MLGDTNNIYGGKYPYELPAYTPAEAARYLRIPVSTVRSWLKGYWYKTKSGTRLFRRVIVPAHKSYISFQNLIELFVLHSLRALHTVPLPNIRDAVQYLREKFNAEHPLANYELLTDKQEIFIELLNEYLNISQQGQWEMKEELRQCVSRIEKNDTGIPSRMFPYIKRDGREDIKKIQIDPAIQFGRPCIMGTGILTEVIYDRCRAGESLEILAFDYECRIDEIHDAIAYEEDIRTRVA